MFYFRLGELCNARGVSLTSFVEDILKMSRSNVTKWKDGNVPKSDTVSRIASYFNVSTDYLLGNTDEKKPTTVSSDGLDAAKLELIEKIKVMSDDQVDALDSLVNSILKMRDL